MSTGKIGVTTENIFPVIKKFLYSDHEIFLRELVSNAIDATQKLKTLAAFGDFRGELGDMKVSVKVDKEVGTLTVTDHGIGMDAEDIDKYINQIAFSGAEEFLEKYKDTANSIIGHFGLGFYSAFMVADKVEIRSLSYKDGAKAVKWICDGSPEYEMSDSDKKERGTDIILHISEDEKEFLEQARIETLLKKYCRFLPVPVVCGKKQEWKDGKMVDTDSDNIVNATEPLWTRKPSDLSDEDYLKFYHELMPGKEDPMFWIHLNVDYPFTLTGILYFPKITNNIDLERNRIQLYCNQVYVTDQVEGVVPEFMMLMQGVIDSPDIPLNVSRSYLQADRQVKKISAYISKKVAEKLQKMFSENRNLFESKWDDIKVFIEYGMLTDEKFYESARKFFLLKDTDGKYYTLEEYHKLIEASQTDKDGNLVYIYCTNPTEQYSYIQGASEKGLSVLNMDGQLDGHIVSMLESKLEKSRFVRVDSDTPERLIPREESNNTEFDELQREVMTIMFADALPKNEKIHYIVDFQTGLASGLPATIIQSEYLRRMKEMAATQPGAASFYSQLPDSYTLVVNSNSEAVKKLANNAQQHLKSEVEPIRKKIEEFNTQIENKRKESEKDDNASNSTADLEKEVEELRKKENSVVLAWSKDRQEVAQIVDLALLQGGLLKGEELAEFIKRTAQFL